MKWNDRIGRQLKLHDLHVLMAVTEMGSMGKAAERLAVSQPSVSKAISDMEHTIGVRLLDRTPKGVEATAYGRALLRRGMAAFEELREGIKEIGSGRPDGWRGSGRMPRRLHGWPDVGNHRPLLTSTSTGHRARHSR